MELRAIGGPWIEPSSQLPSNVRACPPSVAQVPRTPTGRPHVKDRQTVDWGARQEHAGYQSAERLDGETKRCTYVVAVLPNEDAK